MSKDKVNPQLWQKGLPLDETIHRFTVGDDPELDQRLLKYDALGSAAHALALAHAGLLAERDARALTQALSDIAARAGRGELHIDPSRKTATHSLRCC